MYFYIKYVEGPYLGKKYVVPLSAVKYNFENQKYDAKKKYFVIFKDNKPYKCQILLDAETEKDLQKLINDSKRKNNLPTSQLVSASDSDDTQVKLKSTSSAEKVLTRDEEMSYNKQLNIKLEKLKSISSDIDVTKKKETDLNKLKIGTQNQVTEGLDVHHVRLGDLDENGSANDDSFNDACAKMKDLKKQKLKTSFAKTMGIKILDVDNILKKKSTEISKEALESVCEQASIENSNNEIKSIVSENTKKHEEQINKLNKDILHLQKEVSDLKKDKKKKGKIIDELKKELESEQNQKTEYIELNKKLQNTIIEKFEELSRNDSVLKEVQTNDCDMDHKKNFYPIGYFRKSDNKIHIGRNQWLENQTYNNVINQSKKPIHCVGNILTAVFGISSLRNGTITGRRSNRSGNEAQEVRQLDPVILGACKDFYAHWLKNCYVPKEKESYSYEVDYANFNEHAAKKIAYLKRDVILKSGESKTSATKRTRNKENEKNFKKSKYTHGEEINKLKNSTNNKNDEEVNTSQVEEKVNEVEKSDEKVDGDNLEPLFIEQNLINIKEKSSETDFSPVEDLDELEDPLDVELFKDFKP